MIKREGLILIALTVIIVFCLIYGLTQDKHGIKLVANQSFYSDFEVIDKKVFIKCELVLYNAESSEKHVSLYARFESDASLGLIKTSRLKGYTSDKLSDEFKLIPGINRVIVVFVGDFAGVDKKSTRDLPPVEIFVK